MSDIRCVVCGEPWEAYGIAESMAPWELVLFRAGAGCPCCTGDEPDPPYHPKTIRDVANGDEDESERIALYKARAQRPAWIRPKDPVVWTCHACEGSARTDLDTGDAYWTIAPAYARHGDAYQRERDTDCDRPEGAEHELVCSECAHRCYDCGCDLASGPAIDDDYDSPLRCHYTEGDYNGRKPLCGRCIEERCTHCEQHESACACCHCDAYGGEAHERGDARYRGKCREGLEDDDEDEDDEDEGASPPDASPPSE